MVGWKINDSQSTGYLHSSNLIYRISRSINHQSNIKMYNFDSECLRLLGSVICCLGGISRLGSSPGSIKWNFTVRNERRCNQTNTSLLESSHTAMKSKALKYFQFHYTIYCNQYSWYSYYCVIIVPRVMLSSSVWCKLK